MTIKPVLVFATNTDLVFFRITGFLDAWPKIEKWYAKFGTLRSVDATQEEKSVYLEVDKILEDTLNKV